MNYILLFLLSFFSFKAFSSTNLVKVLNVSKSKKSLIIDRGSNHKIFEDDYAVLLYEKESSQNQDKRKILAPVAKLKSVKTYQQNSTWIVYKAYDESQIASGLNYYLIRESELLEGRTNLKIKRTELVTNSQVTKELKENLIENGQELSVKKDQYGEEVTLHDKEKHYQADVRLVDVSTWDKQKKSNDLEKVSIYKSAYAKDFSDRKRIATFEKMLVYYLARVNDPKFDFNKFYQEQKRAPNVGELQDKMVKDNYKSRYDGKIRNENNKLEIIANQIAKKEDGWSDSYSDEELSNLISNVGQIREKQRRVDILGLKYDNQIFFSTGLSLLDNQLLNNAQNLQKNKFEVEFSLESYILKNLESLNRLTFEFSLRSNQDGVSVGNFNAKILEYSGAAHINWYPFHNPYLLDKNIFYVGLLFRWGLASLIIDSEAEQGIYQATAIPGFRMGIKYNYYNGYGLRLVGTFENITLDRVEDTTGGNNLSGREKYVDGKVCFSVSKLF